jgi:hypothetical protein
MQVTWAYNQPWLQHWKEQAAMFPNNEKITDRLQASESKDETVQSIWIAADKAYHNAVNRIQGDFDPPLQYWRSNNRVLTEAFERHKQRKFRTILIQTIENFSLIIWVLGPVRYTK